MSNPAHSRLASPGMPLCGAEEVCPPPDSSPLPAHAPEDPLCPWGEAALAYAALGWRVLPVIPVADLRASLGVRGLRDATTCPDQIRRWWRGFPGADLAIALGPDSGVWSLTVHPELGGVEALAALERNQGPWPVTVEARPAEGVRILFFAWLPELHLATWAPIGPGLVVKGPGDFQLVPAHAQRRWWTRFDWTPGRSPFERRPAKPPEHLVGLIRERWRPTP